MTPDDVRAAAEQLVALHEDFAPLFGKDQAQDHASDDLKELMICPDRKSVAPIARLVGHCDVSGLQKFLTSAPWPHDDVQAELQAVWAERLAPSGLGALTGVVGILDQSCFTRKGVHSAGVAVRLHGRLDKQDNCQVGVLLLGVTPAGVTLLDHQLYLPQSGCEASAEAWERRERVPISAEVGFRTKPQIAADRIRNRRSG
jgi:SRSO17 transposase